MARRLRLWIPGGIYHLTVRGNNREPLFFDELDCQQYLIEAWQSREAEPHQLLAFALMPNHVHLVIECHPDGSPSRMMHRISTAYARYFNARYGHVGHVYQGRFYSNHVDRESYLLEVTRYVHLNPVRAGLARRAEDYAWSSYRTYVGIPGNELKWVERDRILGLFGNTEPEQFQRYRRFVEEMAEKELAFRKLVLRLQRDKLIPPKRWLTPKVPGTSPLRKVPGTSALWKSA